MAALWLQKIRCGKLLRCFIERLESRGLCHLQAVVVLRPESTFGALVVIQAIHSVEECVGRLWVSYPPARFVASLFSENHAQSFVGLNVVLGAFGAWCYFFPVRRRWALAQALLWLWAIVEVINGIAHPVWSIWSGGYTPGVATAPLLLFLAAYLGRQLMTQPSVSQTDA